MFAPPLPLRTLSLRVAALAGVAYLILATVDFGGEPVGPPVLRPGAARAPHGMARTAGTAEELWVGTTDADGVARRASVPGRGIVLAAARTEAPQSGIVLASFPAAQATLQAPAVANVLDDAPADEAEDPRRGVASWYGRGFHGLPTASGERFDMHELTAAHRTLPFGTAVEVRNPRNGRAVVVRINDRGPYSRRREIDLSYAAARDLGIAGRGIARVELRVLR